MATTDRWRRALKGHGWLEVRRHGETVRQTPITPNVITDLGLNFAFWTIMTGQNNNTYGSPIGFLGSMVTPFNGAQSPTIVGNTVYYDGTYYHASWANPLAFLYASTDDSTPSDSTNVLPGGTLIALGVARAQGNSGLTGGSVQFTSPTGQSVSGGWTFSAITGTSPSISQQSTTSVLVTVPFIPYAGSSTITVGSVGFTSGLYASTSSTTSWPTIDGDEMALTGSSSPASTKDLSIGTKLVPSDTLSVTNGEQLVVNYQVSFTPA